MLVGPGDDAAVLRVKTGHVVVSTDLMVEGRHFRRDWASAADVGHRAAAQNLSDINAMGGRATSLTIGLAAPADLPVQWALDFAPRLRRRVRAGRCQRRRRRPDPRRPGRDRGDRARRLHRGAGAALGCPARRRARARGRQGWAAGGLAVLGRGFRSPRVLVEAYRRPEPPYDAGPGRRRGRRDRDDRHLRRAARRRRPHRRRLGRRDRRRTRRRSRSPSRCTRSAPRSAPTRSSSSSAAATTTRCWRPSPTRRGARRLGGHRRGRGRARASPSTARRTTARPAGPTSSVSSPTCRSRLL